MAGDEGLRGRHEPAPGARAARPGPRRPDLTTRRPLGPAFYRRPVLQVAPALIGCVLRHGETAGVIVETEAYHESEPACHAHVGVTARTGPLFDAPGIAYVYRSYGIHALVNAVCEPEGIGAAVLIRALEPITGLELMAARRGVAGERALCSGPGKLTQALGISLTHNESSLIDGPIAVLRRPAAWRAPAIVVDTRIGITKAAELPWRFTAAGSRFVSRPPRRDAVAL